ncbi:MAG TPA: hypothetical protein VIX81_09345 [Gammaproteobacteria bacterium]
MRTRFLQRLERFGIAGDRVELMDRVADRSEHLRVYHRVDIALDCMPYNGTTTTCEALWMGVPVIALRGDRHAARVGASILTHAGLPELVAEDADDYVAKAVALAADAARLRGYHAGLRDRLLGSTLCDADGFARQVEEAYREMWRRHVDSSSDAA